MFCELSRCSDTDWGRRTSDLALASWVGELLDRFFSESATNEVLQFIAGGWSVDRYGADSALGLPGITVMGSSSNVYPSRQRTQ